MPKVDFDTINFKNDDKLGREDSADLITNYLLNQEESRVISLNSAWGTGKTWFAHMWKNKLRDDIKYKEKIIPIYYNAWENDDYEDALIPLINQIYLQLNDFSEYRKENLNLVVLLKAISAFYKHSLSTPIKALSKGTFNLKEFVEGVKESKKTIDDVLLPEFDDQLKIYNDYDYAKKVFTEYFSEFIKDINKTIIIIVDELDRCRPTFAIETLERIKHFFGIEKLHFILLQDSEQLSHSVEILYGQKCDTSGYLKRFVDLEFALPKHNIKKYIDSFFSSTYIGLDNMISEFNDLFLFFELSLRDFNKFTIWFDFYKTFGEDINHSIYSQFLFIYFSLIRLKNTEEYKKYIDDENYILNNNVNDFYLYEKITSKYSYTSRIFEFLLDAINLEDDKLVSKYKQENWNLSGIRNENISIRKIPRTLNIINKITGK